MTERFEPHDSGGKHVTGAALYVDDIPVDGRLLTGKVVTSPHAHARIVSFDLTAARQLPGVHAVLSHADIPGENQMGPVIHDEPVLAVSETTCIGQAVFLIAAETDELCRQAERLISVTYEPLDAILDIPTAMERGSLMGPPRIMNRGNAAAALAASPDRISGELETGAQEHWYLETQVCLCVPGESGEIRAYSSSQHPSETQALIAEVLGLGKNSVEVEVTRVGGGFGGKETQANHVACWAALLCHATRRPVRIRLCRDDDMSITGKRHPYLIRYEAGFDDTGALTALRFALNADGGNATDLSFAILERAMLLCDNAYYVPDFEVTGTVWRTNLPSNTAFRGFGGPQGMAGIETVIDRIARHLRQDPAVIRRRNFYSPSRGNTTHYGQEIENNRLDRIYDELIQSSDYVNRSRAVESFNRSNEFVKKGIALTPVKFGISFTTTFLNQAGALVNVYRDGTVLVNHGGIEMGQGLNTKMVHVAANAFGLPAAFIRVNATNTSKVPNTSATAASSGSDLNGMAVKHAIETIKSRIAPEMAAVFSEKAAGGPPTSAGAIRFADGFISDAEHPDRRMAFAEAMSLMNFRQVSLSAAGFYRTPGIGWDKVKGHGKPFYYFAFGMAVTEVTVDILTGSHTIDRVDILQDVGDSINPGIDIGQIEGGYVQGLGWCTTEEIRRSTTGLLLTHSPDTYKIPTIADIPRDIRISLLTNAENPGTIQGSKAVGEPPFMLALSAWLAIKDAVSAVAEHRVEPAFRIPATAEAIVLAAEQLRTSDIHHV